MGDGQDLHLHHPLPLLLSKTTRSRLYGVDEQMDATAGHLLAVVQVASRVKVVVPVASRVSH